MEWRERVGGTYLFEEVLFTTEEEDVRFGRVHLVVFPADALGDADIAPLLDGEDAQNPRLGWVKVRFREQLEHWLWQNHVSDPSNPASVPHRLGIARERRSEGWVGHTDIPIHRRCTCRCNESYPTSQLCQHQHPIQKKRQGEARGWDIPFEIVFVRGLFWVLCIVFRHGGRCEVVVVVE